MIHAVSLKHIFCEKTLRDGKDSSKSPALERLKHHQPFGIQLIYIDLSPVSPILVSSHLSEVIIPCVCVCVISASQGRYLKMHRRVTLDVEIMTAIMAI